MCSFTLAACRVHDKLFIIGKILSRRKNFNLVNEAILKVFNLLEVRKNSKVFQIPICGFQCVAKIIERLTIHNWYIARFG
jgi:hypothetical protein